MRRFLKWATRPGTSKTGRPDSGRRCAELPVSNSTTASVALVHFADKSFAIPGETVTFTAWILNDSQEQLRHVSLMPRSFTIGNHKGLQYTDQPDKQELTFGPMPPGASRVFTFTYVVPGEGQIHGGELASVMHVKATSTTSGTLWDECDATVRLGHPEFCRVCK